MNDVSGICSVLRQGFERKLDARNWQSTSLLKFARAAKEGNAILIIDNANEQIRTKMLRDIAETARYNIVLS